MKYLVKIALIAFLALSTAAAFAGDKQSIPLTIHEDAVIAGVKVPAGDYKMTIERDGGSVKFALMRGSKTVVSTPARFVELTGFSAPTAVVTGANSEVHQIQVAKLKGAIAFDSKNGAAGGN